METLKYVQDLIDDVKQITKSYTNKNVYKERFIDNENVLYYSVTLWGNDDIRDLAFIIEYYKNTKQMLPIICNTRDYILHETLNIESVKIAIDKLKENIK